jgi:hypothetical protein
MKNFAIIDGTEVINTITAENSTIAQQVVGLSKTVVEFVIPEVNDQYIDGQFIKQFKPQVQLSWAVDLGV